MIVSCHQCQAPYQVEEDQVGGDGLALECTACRAQFRVVRKAVYLVEAFKAEVNETVRPATPAPPEESKKAGPADAATAAAAPAKKKRIALPVSYRKATEWEREAGHPIRTFLLLALGVSLLVFWLRRIYPEHYQQTVSELDRNYQSVMTRLQKTEGIAPEAKAQFLRGRGLAVLDTEEGYRGAIEAYRQAIGIDGGYAPLYGSLAESAAELAELAVLRNDGQAAKEWLEESLRASTRGTTLNARCIEAFRGVAAYERLQGRFVQAQEQLDRALIQDPKDAEIYVAIGRNYLSRTGLEDMAREYLLKAIAMDERSIRAHRYLAAVFDRQGRYGDALKQWQKVLDLNGQHAVAQFETARLQALVDGARSVSTQAKAQKAAAPPEEPAEPQLE